MKKSRHIIREVKEGSIAREMDLEPGDELLAIDDVFPEDVFDYQFLTENENINVLIRKKNGEEWLLEVEKDEDEDLGLTFESSLMDEYRSCSNHCIFCFIDQMPPGMRDTLYFKDDDSRLSFLQGNYVTLTNMKDHDIDRLIRYHLSPINISFQTTNPELRCMMLHNRFAGDIMKKAQRLADAGLTMNGQIVLCKGINDGEELERSVRDLAGLMPALQSVSVVPVGISKYREGLYPLEPFGKEDAKAVLRQIGKWQKMIYQEHGIHFIHASDEWYLLADEPLPEEDSYDGYPQLENGVGMLRLLYTEFEEALAARQGDSRKASVSAATGALAGPHLRRLAELLREKFPGVHTEVYEIRNDFFGETITVSGLITGQDLIKQLAGKDLGERLLIPCNMLRQGEEVFLDDVTVTEAERILGVPIIVTDPEGSSLLRGILDGCREDQHKRRQIYEQTDRCDRGTAECGEVHTV